MAKSFLNQSGLPIGLRNNNPGNIRPSGDNWKGMTGTNGGFVVFSNIAWGLRAEGVDLRTKINEGYNTVAKIITRHAPPEDGNDTAAYIQHVCDSTGFAPNQILSATQPTLHALIKAIISQENGSYSYLLTDADIDEGMALMGGGFASAVDSPLGLAVIFLVGLMIITHPGK